jgi:hypothetical protein
MASVMTSSVVDDGLESRFGISSVMGEGNVSHAWLMCTLHDQYLDQTW